MIVRGIQKFMKIIKEIPDFETIEFTIPDIVRSDFLKSYIVAKYKMGF
jgi:phosphate starvation-inducible protein PhoH